MRGRISDQPTTQFKKDYKLAMRRGLDIRLLEGVIANLVMGIPLPEKNRDHALSGNWVGHRECHVLPTGCLSTALTMMFSMRRRINEKAWSIHFAWKGRKEMVKILWNKLEHGLSSLKISR